MLYTFFTILGPTAVPILLWGENPLYALFVAYFFRTVLSLNGTWSVNSAAHMFGTRAYDKYVRCGKWEQIPIYIVSYFFLELSGQSKTCSCRSWRWEKVGTTTITLSPGTTEPRSTERHWIWPELWSTFSPNGEPFGTGKLPPPTWWDNFNWISKAKSKT